MQLFTEVPTWLTPTLYKQGCITENPRIGKRSDNMQSLHVRWSLIPAGFVDKLPNGFLRSFFYIYRTVLQKV
jgi:hypothetical protein